MSIVTGCQSRTTRAAYPEFGDSVGLAQQYTLPQIYDGPEKLADVLDALQQDALPATVHAVKSKGLKLTRLMTKESLTHVQKTAGGSHVGLSVGNDARGMFFWTSSNL